MSVLLQFLGGILAVLQDNKTGQILTWEAAWETKKMLKFPNVSVVTVSQ